MNIYLLPCYQDKWQDHACLFSGLNYVESGLNKFITFSLALT